MKRISVEDLEHVYNHTRDIWDGISNKSIFITGATGFFGKWLLESFLYINKKLSLNAKVCALSRNPEAFLVQYPFYREETWISFIKGDVQTFDFPPGDFNFIIHAATDADAKLNSENPLSMLDTITIGTKRVLDFARRQRLTSFLLVSSGAVYGSQPTSVELANEIDNYKFDFNESNPASAYIQGKRTAELYGALHYKQYNTPIKIARCFAFVGPHIPLNKHYAIGNFIFNGLKGEDIVINGDGAPYRSYLYAADLMIWLWVILMRGENNSPYNVGSDYSVSIKETADIVADSFDHGIDVKVLGKPSKSPTQRYVPAIQKACGTLNLKVNVGIKEAIGRTIQFNR